METNLITSEGDLNKWENDRNSTQESMDSFSKLISKKILLKNSFSKVRKNINLIVNREVDATKENLDILKSEYKSNVDILNSKIEQQNIISNNSSYKEELKNQEIILQFSMILIQYRLSQIHF